MSQRLKIYESLGTAERLRGRKLYLVLGRSGRYNQ